MARKTTLSVIGLFTMLVLSLAAVSAAVTNLSPTGVFSDGDGDVIFSFNVSDNSSVGVCTLHYNGDKKTNTSLIVNGSNSIQVNDLDKNQYEWFVSCENGWNSSKSTFYLTGDDESYNLCPTPSDFNTTIIQIKDFDDVSTGTEDDWEWKPLDNIGIEVEIDNDGDEDVELDVRLAFFEAGTSNEIDAEDIVTDEDDLEENGVDINDGKDETITFNFQIDGEVVDDRYDLYVIVEEQGGEDHCNFQIAEQEIDISKQSRDVVVQEVTGPVTVEGGNSEIYEVEVANIGAYDEDQVKIIAYNSELGIKIEKEIEDLDEGDQETLTFEIDFPDDVEEKIYKIRFSTEFDYDDDDEIYDEESDSEDDILYAVTVLSTKQTPTVPTIGANLKSEAVEGEELVVEVSVTGIEGYGAYVLSVEGADTWSESAEIQPQVLALSEGETKMAVITLKPIKAGTQTFTLKTIYGDQETTQPVTVTIAEKEGIFSSLFNDSSLLTTILIAAIVVLVVIILVVLLVKALSRPKAPQY